MDTSRLAGTFAEKMKAAANAVVGIDSELEHSGFTIF